MGSFFEKLKKGMGLPVNEEEEIKEVKKEKILVKPKVKEMKIESRVEVEKPKIVEEKLIKGEEEPLPVKVVEDKEKKWPEPEGELAIDVYQTENDLVIRSAIAGVKPEFLDISIERDVISIKGAREKPIEEEGDYFTQECYWGPFSREVILPVEVDPNQSEASMKEGILTIRIPKIQREKKRKIKVKS